MDGPNLIGLTGAIISGSAYLPQIRHLIKEQCSAGISRSAFAMWLIASVLITINAVYIEAIVFIVLGILQILATAIIFAYSTKYQGKVCPFHQHHPENS
jgi:uncharacterized protein with PQ loop repeat